jgi:tetratricopeptide (TPR) repeat protein
LAIGWSIGADAADLSAAIRLHLRGDYTNCLEACQGAIKQGSPGEQWHHWQVRSQLALGRYPEALTNVVVALAEHRASLRLRLLAHEVFTANGDVDRARGVLLDANELGGSRGRSYPDAASRVALGQAALLLGAEPKRVLEVCFEPAQQADPELREAPLAIGQLALDKHDFALAAKTFTGALTRFPEDADLHYGLARAYAPSARGPALESLETALKFNPNHVPALVLGADLAIDAEDYAAADRVLERALTINPWHPEAWAYRAVLRHLENRRDAEAQARKHALRFWPTNPKVDHVIGRKLSQKYRFAEGAGLQRQALKLSPSFLPAQIQLAQDLLRLGEEPEGWQLARQVQQLDGYDVTAFNLAALHDTLGKFRTLTNEHFILRLSPQEASLYGDRALALLERARVRLNERYGVASDRPTVVEIFPEQKDFAVRTFGMPDNPGYLGVCFGRVITANSPASQTAHPANWEAVLWHEYAHVVTLQLTRNRMPRWLSEGISVYEERQAHPGWGQSMTPQFRAMILSDGLVPVGELSSAFLAPKTPWHLQFAYFQSSLVVEFLVDRYGFDALKRILHGLGEGRAINETLAANTAPLPEIERGFAAFARERAEAFGPGLDWTPLEDMSPGLSQATARRAGPGRDRRPAQLGPVATNLANLSAPTNALESMQSRYGLGQDGTNTARDLASKDLPTLRSSPTNTPATPDPARPNFWRLSRRAQELVAEKRWQEAKEPLERLVRLYPEDTGSDSSYRWLAQVHRGLNEAPEEQAVLARWAATDVTATEAFLRLMELGDTAGDWGMVAENAERYLAVNPLVPAPHRYLARASEELGRREAARRSYEKLLQLDPPDPAQVHYRVARLLAAEDDRVLARRHVLQALEEAPRYQDALRLLLGLQDTPASPADASVKP